MKEEITKDKQIFGDCYVYCSQHLRPHKTGWCTVHVSEKIKLNAENNEDVFDECKNKGYTVL